MNHDLRGRTLDEVIKMATRSSQAKCTLSGVSVDTKSIFSVWAPPLTWGPWTEIFRSIGRLGEDRHEAQIRKTISYRSASQAKSTFDVEIRGGDRFVSSVGPGSSHVAITGNVLTAISIRARSHSVGQQVRVSVR